MASRSSHVVLDRFVLFACMAVNAQPTIKKVPVTPTSAASGSEMFKTYCAACHGLDGKGTGPAAAALKKQPANLTELSAKNGGAFPELKVFNTIKGDSDSFRAWQPGYARLGRRCSPIGHVTARARFNCG